MDDRTAEKIEVDIRTIMKVYAEHYGRPVAVMEAMVSRASSLYQVHFEDAETEYLTGDELKLLEENIERGRDRRRIADTKIIKAEGKLLELSAPQALDYGIADEVVESRDAFYEARGIAAGDIVRPEIAPGEMDLKKLLPNLADLGLPVWVVLLLAVFLVVGIAGFVTEYHAPGSGIPMAAGIIGFVCFFATLLMHDRGSPLGISLFIAGIILLIVEIMVLPGFGVAGILGVVGVLGGLFLAFTPDWNSEYMHEFMWEEMGAFVLLLGAGLAAAVAVIYFISRYGEKLPVIGKAFMTADADAGAANAYQREVESRARESARARTDSARGREGTAETPLRPAGKVRLDSGELLDVVTDGSYIEEGRRVVVLEVSGSRIVVAAVREPAV
jgi:membrane-bound serine protease (ClpP class)